MPELDDVDARILGILVEDGRRSFREVARRAGITTPTVQARVKRMMDEGLIRKISPVFDVSKFKQGLVFHLYLRAQAKGSCDTNRVFQLPLESRSQATELYICKAQQFRDTPLYSRVWRKIPSPACMWRGVNTP